MLYGNERGNAQNLLLSSKKLKNTVLDYFHTTLQKSGFFSYRTLHNFNSRGEGPPRIKGGKRTGYLTRDFAEWFAARVIITDRGAE
jgi:hypothetical protein